MPLPIDQIKLNINDSSLLLLKFMIAFLMYSIALELKIKDFQEVLKKPKALLLGISIQLLFLPLITYIFVTRMNLGASLSLGLILLSLCPVGNLANVVSALSKAKLALSISLTAFSNFVCLVVTPLYLIWMGKPFFDKLGLKGEVQLNVTEVAVDIFLQLGLPLALGMLTTQKYPAFAARIQTLLKKIASLMLLLFIIFALIANFTYFKEHAFSILSVTFGHHIIILLLIFALAYPCKLQFPETKALVTTTLLKNTGIGLALALQFFPALGGMSLLVAFATISQLTTGLIFSKVSSKY